MPFIKATHNEMDSYLLDVQNNLLSTWLAIHDEVDLMIDFNIAKPIMKKVTAISHLKKEINKISAVPYINFIFDTEWDEFGSFTAGKNFGASTDIPKDRTENNAYREYKRFKELITTGKVTEVKAEKPTLDKPEKVTTTKTPSIKIKDERAFDLLLQIIDLLPDGNTQINFQLSDGKLLKNNRLVDIAMFEKAFKECAAE